MTDDVGRDSSFSFVLSEPPKQQPGVILKVGHTAENFGLTFADHGAPSFPLWHTNSVAMSADIDFPLAIAASDV